MTKPAISRFKQFVGPPYKLSDLIVIFLTLLVLLTLPLIILGTRENQGYDSLASGSKCEKKDLSDAIAPTVNIVSPDEGSHLTGSKLEIKVEGDDNICLSRLFLLIDGKVVKSQNRSFVYDWDLSKVRAGNHKIEAKAVDQASNASSDSVSIFRGVKEILAN